MRWAVLCVFLAGCVPAAESNESPTSVYEEPVKTVSFQDKLEELERRVDLQTKFQGKVLEQNSEKSQVFQGIWNRLKALEEEEVGQVVAAIQNQIDDLNEENKSLRWDIDDLLIRTRSPEETAKAAEIAKEDPASAVEVSEDYPKWRIPYGVKIDDQRPPELVAQKIERMKAGEKGTVYMWLSLPGSKPGRELRIYMTKVDYRKPGKPVEPAAPAEQDTRSPAAVPLE